MFRIVLMREDGLQEAVNIGVVWFESDGLPQRFLSGARIAVRHANQTEVGISLCVIGLES
jgi:hypothetical protein